MFLRGVGGAVLAIPFLPSLHKKAFAADPTLGPVAKRFFALRTGHGGVWHSDFFPDESMLTGSPLNYAGRDVRWGALPTAANEEGRVHWSGVCNADATLLTPALASKFNILKGIDIPWQPGHQTGVSLGYLTEGAVGNFGSQIREAYQNPTIDQVMAYSPSFYSAADLQTQTIRRAFHVGHPFSYNYQKPLDKSGPQVQQPRYKNNVKLFNYLFKATSSLHDMDQLIVDRIKASYDQLKASPKLSKGDFQRLEQHMEKMFEVERLVALSENLTDLPNPNLYDTDGWTYKGSFGQIPSYQNPTENYLSLMLDVIVMALSTGASRIGTWGQSLQLTSTLFNDWHGAVAHEGEGPIKSAGWARSHNQRTFEYVMVELASRLNDIPAEDGQTLLDHSLITFTQESGQISHHTGCKTMPVIMAGGAGGALNTGYFVDYTDPTKLVQSFNYVLASKPGIMPEYAGLMYNQFLTTCMLSMGVPKEDWPDFREITSSGPGASAPVEGFGHYYAGSNWDLAKNVMGEPLPIITG
jgi:hypothetical protein